MKRIFLLTLIVSINLGAFAQVYNPSIPNYTDPILVNVLQNNYYSKDKQGAFNRKNTSAEAFRDTIMPIFSQFAVGGNVYSKNANVLTAELASKDARLSYNAAAYSKKFKGIYNAELFASGKDNLAGVFSKTKFKGTFGINVSSSYLIKSSLYFNGLGADTLHEKRLLYAWALQDLAKEMTDGVQEGIVKTEINRLEGMLTGGTLMGFNNREEVFGKLIKLQDSLKKFLPAAEKIKFYEQKLTAFDKKFAKWTGFNMITFDVKFGMSSEGFNHYTIVDQPYVYPVISENGKRFSRIGVGIAINLIHSGRWFASKSSVGIGISNFIGFDGESADDISQSIKYDSLNTSRTIDKKYTAYELKDKMLDTYEGAVWSVNHQMLFGKNKVFGFGFGCSRSDFFSGQYKGKVGIDNTYSLLLALSKKGDILNKNVLAISIKTPDIRADLPKSFDNKTGNKLRVKDKLEIGITFGLTIDKLLGK